MNSIIKAFWKKEGYILENEDQTTSGVVTGYKRNIKNASVSLIETLAFGDQHRYKGVWYSEEKMLRIIKLMVFL